MSNLLVPFYVGETSWPINSGIKEHKTSTMKSDSKLAISDHTSNCPNHNIDWENVKILSNNLKYSLLDKKKWIMPEVMTVLFFDLIHAIHYLFSVSRNKILNTWSINVIDKPRFLV